MVKLQGPAMSQGAAGKLGGSLVFANSLRGTYAKKLTAPKQPRSPAQLSIRAMVRFLSQQWASVSAGDKQTWNDLAAAAGVAPYHAFLGHNTRRWRNKLTPTVRHPAENEDPLTDEFTLHATAGVRLATLRLSNDHFPPESWIHLVFHSLAPGADTSWHNLVHVEIVDDAFVNHYWTHNGLTAGWHYYTSTVANEDGNSNFSVTSTAAALVTDQ